MSLYESKTVLCFAKNFEPDLLGTCGKPKINEKCAKNNRLFPKENSGSAIIPLRSSVQFIDYCMVLYVLVK